VQFAVVDIETTGGYAASNGIIEISIHITDGKMVLDHFETLINPNQEIPWYIQKLTGISNEMVQRAVQFEQVAKKIHTMLEGRIFVAHNVNFDYSFVKSHLEYHGYQLQCKKLCTIRMARQIFPGFPSYSLGNLCYSLGIEIKNMHRAGGDSAATTTLLHQLLAKDEKGIIANALKRGTGEQCYPPNVKKDDFLKLPPAPGVYYFHDQKGNVVYVGKAKDIKKRVNSHFTNNGDGKQRQNFMRYVYSISYQQTATELMAAILESTEIKKLWPRFNNAQKNQEDLYGIFMYEDQNGYMRLAIEKKRRHSHPIYTFHYKVDAFGVLRKLVKEFQLCPKLCFIQTDKSECQGIEETYCKGACKKTEQPSTYNHRILEAIASLTHKPSYVVLDSGLTEKEISCIMVVNGSFFGMGYLPANLDNITVDTVTPYIKPYKENSFIRTLLRTHFNQFQSQVRILQGAG
jgi:DNA polymerase-3 subunit epsilon